MPSSWQSQERKREKSTGYMTTTEQNSYEKSSTSVIFVLLLLLSSSFILDFQCIIFRINTIRRSKRRHTTFRFHFISFLFCVYNHFPFDKNMYNIIWNAIDMNRISSYHIFLINQRERMNKFLYSFLISSLLLLAAAATTTVMLHTFLDGI